MEVSQNPTEVRGKVPLFDEMMLLECLPTGGLHRS